MNVIGIDEAGRGSLAGPVVVAAVVIPKGFYPRSSHLPKLRDSKKLSARQRELWFEYIKTHPNIFYASARVYPRGIEKKNISNSANLAASRSLEMLYRNAYARPYRDTISIDGSLYLDMNRHSDLNAKTIIRGDEKIVAIKLASIVAKVTRDAYMIRLHKRYPLYQFDLHKGYGTELHRKMIKKYGPSDAHRLTYITKWVE